MVALYQSLGPALWRSITYGCLRLGLYEPIKKSFLPERKDQTLAKKIAAGILAGGFATVATNPMDVVKVGLTISFLHIVPSVCGKLVSEVRGIDQGTTADHCTEYF